MKKLICFALCLLLFVPSALAETAPRKLTEDEPLYTSLYERSMELAYLFDEALRSDEYLQLFLPDLTAVEETLSLLWAQDFTQPCDTAVVQSEELLATPYVQLLPAEKSSLSANLTEYIKERLYNAGGSILTALDSDASAIVLLENILAFSDAYICPEELTSPCFVLMQYGGPYAFLVTFCPTANGTVTVNAQFIPSRAADALNIPLE